MLKLLVSFPLVWLTAAAARSQPPKVLDEKYVSPGFALAVTFEPARFHKAAKAAGLPTDDWWEQARKQSGIDLTQVERVTGLQEPLLSWSVLGMGAIALRYPDGVDRRAKLAEILGDDAVKTTAGDHSYYRSKKYRFLDQAELEMAGYADRDVLLSVWPMLEYMLGVPWDDKRFEKELDRRLARNFAFGNLTPPTGKPSPLGRTLNAADVNHDLVLIFTPRPILDKLAKLKDWKDPPAEVSKDYLPVWLALKRTEAVVATLDFGAEVFMRVEFRAAGAEGAKVVLEGLTVLLAKAKADYPGVRQELLSDLSPEVRTPILAVVDELISDHALVLDGNAVALTIRRPKNLVYQK